MSRPTDPQLVLGLPTSPGMESQSQQSASEPWKGSVLPTSDVDPSIRRYAPPRRIEMGGCGDVCAERLPFSSARAAVCRAPWRYASSPVTFAR